MRFLTCGIGRPHSSLLKSLEISGARLVGRRLPLVVLTTWVTLGVVALIEEKGRKVTPVDSEVQRVRS